MSTAWRGFPLPPVQALRWAGDPRPLLWGLAAGASGNEPLLSLGRWTQERLKWGGGALLALEEGVAGQKEAELKPRNKIQGCCLLLVTLGKGFICFLTKVVQPGG